MVPVSAFAAVVAMAGPQRLAAESTVQEAADDLAAFTVVWRDGYLEPTGQLAAFPLSCDEPNEAHQAELDALIMDRDDLIGIGANDPDHLEYGNFLLAVEKLEARKGYVRQWHASCELLLVSLLSDLGQLGIDGNSLEGFYSDSLSRSPLDPAKVPCKLSERVMMRDAVHVALAADWQDAGWAAAQVWPDGSRMAAESISRLSQTDTAAASLSTYDCEQEFFEFLDAQGRPVWATGDPAPHSRDLVQSIRRTRLSE